MLKSGLEAPRILKWFPEGLGLATTMGSPVGRVDQTGTLKVETLVGTTTRITRTVGKEAGMVVGPTHLKGVDLIQELVGQGVELKITHQVGLMVARAVGLILAVTAIISTIGNDGEVYEADFFS